MDHELIVLTTVVAAVAFGILAQVIAHRWHLPTIVLLRRHGDSPESVHSDHIW